MSNRARDILWQIGLVFGLCMCGEAIQVILPIPFPASVISMVILFVLLLLKLIKPQQIRDTADFLRENMSFLFVPSSVGIMQYFSTLQTVWLPFLTICLTSTVVTFAATSYAVRATVAIQEKLRVRKGEST